MLCCKETRDPNVGDIFVAHACASNRRQHWKHAPATGPRPCLPCGKIMFQIRLVEMIHVYFLCQFCILANFKFETIFPDMPKIFNF